MEPKHTASIMACARWETPYVTEWLLYHQSIGFDHVYLYCNDDDPTDLYGEILPFCRGERPFVTFHHFPYQGQRFHMMMHALRHYRSETNWVAFLDIDEFLALPNRDDIRQLLQAFPAYWDAIHINRSFFGDNGHQERTIGSVLCGYTRRQAGLHPTTKTLTRAGRIDPEKLGPGVPFWCDWGTAFGPDFQAVNVLGEPIERVRGTDGGANYLRSAETEARLRNIAVINHYAWKSSNDHELRIRRGLLGDFAHYAVGQPAGGDDLAALNAVQDTYLADYWQRQLRLPPPAIVVSGSQLPNLARGCPADQSSRADDAHGATTREDADGVVSGTITGTAQCHTRVEPHPWWLVDLGAPQLVYDVRVFNRVDRPTPHADGLRVEIDDGTGTWVPIHQHAGPAPIGGADGHPLIVKLGVPVVARRVRIVAVGVTSLQLDQVQVHGVPAEDRAPMPAKPAPAVSQPKPRAAAPSPASAAQPSPVPAAFGLEVGRIALSELLALTRREAAILEDFSYAACLAPAGRYTRRRPLCCDTQDALALTQMLQAEYLERETQTYPPTFHVGLRDATVFGEGSVVTKGGALLLESCWEFFSQGGMPPGLRPAPNRHYRLERAASRHIDRPTLLVKRPFCFNYGHWLVDGAALLTWLPSMRVPDDCQILIAAHGDAKMRATVRETLDILAPGRTVLEQPDEEVWTFSALHYVTPPRISPLIMHPTAMAALAQRLDGGQASPATGRRLYVMRHESLGRRLVNEEAVLAVCRQLGFETVLPEQLSLREQVTLFRSAEVVVGVKGAALANAVFGSNATRLFVLSPADWPEPFYWDLVSQRGMAYGEMFGPIRPSSHRQSQHDFTIDSERFARHLADFCQTATQAAEHAVAVETA